MDNEFLVKDIIDLLVNTENDLDMIIGNLEKEYKECELEKNKYIEEYEYMENLQREIAFRQGLKCEVKRIMKAIGDKHYTEYIKII